MENIIIKVLLFSSALLLKKQILMERVSGITPNIPTFHSFIFSEACADRRAFIRCVFMNENLIRRSCVYKTESSKNMPAAVCKWFSGWMNGLFTHGIKYINMSLNVRGFTCWTVPAWMGPTAMIYSPSPEQRHRLGNVAHDVFPEPVKWYASSTVISCQHRCVCWIIFNEHPVC